MSKSEYKRLEGVSGDTDKRFMKDMTDIADIGYTSIIRRHYVSTINE